MPVPPPNCGTRHASYLTAPDALFGPAILSPGRFGMAHWSQWHFGPWWSDSIRLRRPTVSLRPLARVSSDDFRFALREARVGSAPASSSTLWRHNPTPTERTKNMSNHSNEGTRRRRRRRGPPGRPQGVPRAGHKPEPESGLKKFLRAIGLGGFLGKKTPAISSRPPPAGRTDSPPDSFRSARPKKEPPQFSSAEVSAERLYVGNLSYDATESDLFELFNGVGSVRNAEVVVNSRTERSKGFAFVTMGSIEEARRAVEELNGKEFMGRPLQISGAKPFAGGESRNREDS